MGKQKADANVGRVTVQSIQRAGGPGDFTVRVRHPGGEETWQLQRREIVARVDTYSGLTATHYQDACAVFRAILSEFPADGSDMATLVAFADRVGFQIPKTATDASRLWEALFLETPVQATPSMGGIDIVTTRAADQADGAADAEEPTAVATGLEKPAIAPTTRPAEMGVPTR